MNEMQYEAWLRSPVADRVVLCELHHADGVEYVANKPYVSLPTDTPSNQIFDDLVIEVNDIETRIDGQVGFGDVTLIDDGELFEWFDRKWYGHDIRLFLGDPSWSIHDFRPLAVGRNNGITDASNGRLTFEMVDKSEDLEETIDTGQLPDDNGAVPLILGKVYNAPATRVSTQSMRYRVSYLPLVDLQPRDNGQEVAHTKDLISGEFTLNNGTSGTITAWAHEQHDTPEKVAKWVAEQYDIPVAEVLMPDVTVGLHFSDSPNGIEILDELCTGMGGYWYLDQIGRLVVRQLDQPSGFTDLIITPDDFVDQSLVLSVDEQPWKKLTYRWGRNHAALSQVVGYVHDNFPNEAERLGSEWREIEASNPLSGFPKAVEEERDSVIYSRQDAEQEAKRLMALRSKRKQIWELDTFLPMISVGAIVEVEHPRLANKPALVTSVSLKPVLGRAVIEVWVGGYWLPGEMEEAAAQVKIAVNEDLYVNNGEVV